MLLTVHRSGKLLKPLIRSVYLRKKCVKLCISGTIENHTRHKRRHRWRYLGRRGVCQVTLYGSVAMLRLKLLLAITMFVDTSETEIARGVTAATLRPRCTL